MARYMLLVYEEEVGPAEHRRSASAAGIGGRPISQWPRLEAGRSDDLGATGR